MELQRYKKKEETRSCALLYFFFFNIEVFFPLFLLSREVLVSAVGNKCFLFSGLIKGVSFYFSVRESKYVCR